MSDAWAGGLPASSLVHSGPYGRELSTGRIVAAPSLRRVSQVVCETNAHAAQGDVIRASDAVAILGRGRVRSQLRTRRWQQPLRNVLVTHNGPLSVDQRQRAVLLGLPPSAVLGGLTAAARDRFEGFPDDALTAVIGGSSRRPHPWPDVRPDGRAFVDRRWDEYGISCEVHGIPHMAVARWDADLFPQNEIVIAGERLLLFSSFAVRHRSAQVVGQCARALRRQGWTG